MQPYSAVELRPCRFQLIGLLRIEIAGVQEAGVDLDDPPEGAGFDHAARCVARPGKKGNSDEQRTKTCGCSAQQARMASLAGRSMPNGFSPIRCLPAAMAAQ